MLILLIIAFFKHQNRTRYFEYSTTNDYQEKK